MVQEKLSQIEVKEVTDERDLKAFVKFPDNLYKNCPYYVPSIIDEEMEIWNRQKNPSYEYCDSWQFLAVCSNTIVGRIAVIINHKERVDLGVNKVRFGWFDFIDDPAVSKTLLFKAAEIAVAHQISKLEGPMGFTNLDKAGMLTKGFDRLATMIGIYNFSYYPDHLKKLGFKKDKEWVEFELQFPEILPEKVLKFNKLVLEKYGLRVLRFKDKKEILPLIEPMFKLLDTTYRSLSTYTPITDHQITAYREKYFKLLNKDYLICIADSKNELVGFAVTMPSYSLALQKSKGKLLPFGWWHFWRAGIKNERANFYLIGIHPVYQRRGLTSVIFKEIHDVFKKKGVRYLETNPELADNKQVQLLWQDYHPVNHKSRCTFSLSAENFFEQNAKNH